ncbi:DNA polymerase [Ostertagia ostertagi]
MFMRKLMEEEYNEIVRKRQAADFVVDDDGSGYVDHGADIFDDEEDYYDEEEVDKKSKKKKKDKKDQTTKKGLDSYFAPATHVRGKVKDDAEVKLEDDEDLKSMLAGLNDEALEMDFCSEPSPTPSNSSRNPFKREASPTIAPRKVKVMKLATPTQRSAPIRRPQDDPQKYVKAEVQMEEDDDYGAPDFDDFDEPAPPKAPPPTPAVPNATTSAKKHIEKKIENDEVMDHREEIKVQEIKPHTKMAPQMMTSADWEDGQATLDEPSVDVVAGSEAFYVKEDGQQMIRMYWLDAYEDPGTVYLFGRVNVSGSKWASCCVTVKNIFRQVFFLPRGTNTFPRRSTNEPVNDEDVFEEVKAVMKRHCGTSSFKCKQTKKRFMNDGTIAGEYSGEEIKVIEVQYEDGSTRTITDVEVTAKLSYCDYEFSVDMERMRNLTFNTSISLPAPPVRMLILSMITTLNEKKENEWTSLTSVMHSVLCMISTLYNPSCSLSSPSTDQKDLQRLCMFTKPYGSVLPFDIKDQLARRGLSDIVQTAGNEKALLSLFLSKIQKYEPDVIVGHDLSATVALLVSRMDKLKVANWSRTSRLKRTVNVGKVAHNKAGQWELTAGRLLVDSRLSAMELVRSRSYDLSELVSQLLGAQRENIYANEVSTKFSSSQQLLNLIQWSWMDPWFSLRVIAQLNALPLAIQITNIVGGVVSRTLMGGRAERNEFLLLHAFNKANYIAPNKYTSNFRRGKQEKEPVAEDEPNNEEPDKDDKEGKSKNKAQYSGGLVLERRVSFSILIAVNSSLYDTLILYSISILYIQVSSRSLIFASLLSLMSRMADELPEVPSSGLQEGILPREIRGLVERRRQVKKLMKEEALEAKRKQYDIRQMALKLTANSMYGCLGFQQSRFYAKPLAALITSKGREIKRQVNQCHRLLELELDGVFKRMLLLKKKKYAALTVNPDNELDTKKELKGLDIVRRDWSQLAKEAGKFMNHCTRLRARLDEGVDTKLFEISKQLTRNPKDYHDLKSQPHAAVAARLNETGKFSLRHGDIVEYIICEDGTNNSAMQRAYHRTELESNPELKIGMDASSYRRSAAARASDTAAVEDELAWNGLVTYDHCESLSFVCPGPGCENIINIRRAVENHVSAS